MTGDAQAQGGECDLLVPARTFLIVAVYGWPFQKRTVSAKPFFYLVFLDVFISLTIFTDRPVFLPEMKRYLWVLPMFAKNIEN
ncbi:hypothetical protein ACFFL1_02430 [Samsonia erythrinae]|uniref:hypothetical protein n=1 Tax=Samsonia erythrinae TaxID=160434 RepID=UPI001048F435|nr:hypothetical protein [Samsonia erythrinae]